jgi:Methyltransferase domain
MPGFTAHRNRSGEPARRSLGSNMGDYTDMSAYYDLIMTSGYYDYDAIVDHLAQFDQVSTVLEIGAGTGLILERLVGRRPELEIAGIDLTPAMLDIADKRLEPYPQITMHLQNVTTLSLGRQYNLAFSYGGVWYFVPGAAENDFSMISHIRDEEENQLGFERIAAHLPTGGTLLLGIQASHVDYARPVAVGMEYAQRITSIPDGFRKQYSLTDQGVTVMEQTTDYRAYCFEDAIQLLDKCGFEYREGAAVPALFLEFCKR